MKKTLFMSAAALLLISFVVGALLYNARQTEEATERASEFHASLVRAYSPTHGPAEAKVEIVEFLDPACETCKRFYPLVKEFLAAHPERIRLVLRYAPFHENSEFVVALLDAAGRQGKHWETLEALLAAQDDWVQHHRVEPERVWPVVSGLGLDLDRLRADMQAPEVLIRINQDLDDARLLNVTKTPEFFVNGKPMPSFGYDQLKALVDEALADAYR